MQNLDFMIVAYRCSNCGGYVLVHLEDYEVNGNVSVDDGNGVYLDVECPACSGLTSIVLKEARRGNDNARMDN